MQGKAFASLYRPRLPLLAADLAALGCELPEPASALEPVPASDSALLGVVYAIEGSAHGAQIIGAHCRRLFGAAVLHGMRWVTELAPDTNEPNGHWPNVVRAVRGWIVNEHEARLAISGAAFVFEGLRKL